MNNREGINWSELKRWWPIITTFIVVTLWTTTWLWSIKADGIATRKDVEYLKESMVEIAKTANRNGEKNNEQDVNIAILSQAIFKIK